MKSNTAKEFLKSRGLKNPPIDSGISGGDAPRTYVSDIMELYAGQSRWISVYKSLPTADGKYLVIDQDDYISIEIFETKENEFDCAGYIIAWRPLPTPPTP